MPPATKAAQLLAARRSDAIVSWRDILPASAAEAYAVQDATMAQLGPVGGWKVGAKGPDTEPACAGWR
jgi:2-keto-4-pentenoate hydratase